MGCVQSLFKKAQSSGLSPSPTDEVGEKAFGFPEGSANEESKFTKQTVDEVKPPEEPESNDTSYGVEATAVRTLAASTGTVAILGTTAKALESHEPNEEILSEERFKDNPSISVTEAEPEPEESDVQEITDIPDVCVDSHEVLHYENSVVQQKEIKQIVNEALQEKEHGVPSSHIKIGFELDEIDKQVIAEKNSEDLTDITISDEYPQEKLPEVEPSVELLESVSLQAEENKEKDAPTKQESQLPKIVDFQEKKIAPVFTEKFDDVSTPTEKISEEKKVELLSEIEDKPLKETLVVKLEESKEDEEKKTLPTEEEEFVKEVINLPEKQEKDLKEKEIEDDKEEENVEGSDIEGTPDPSPAATEFPSPSEDEAKVPLDSERLSPDISKTEDDNEISSEQLKTNSLSDMSISEGVNSEGEEAAREAAKALELQEMVASLSASANEAALYFRDATSSEYNVVGTSSRKASEKEIATHETIIEEKFSPETNGEDMLPEFPGKRDEDSHKMMAFESPSDSSDPPSNESNASSKPTEESKISDKEDAIESQSVAEKKGGNNIIDKKDIDNTIVQDNKITEDNYNEKIAAAATTIQSSFRGYKARKDLNVIEKDDNLLTTTDVEENEDDRDKSNTKDDQDSPVISDDVFLEKDLEESPEKSHHQSQYSPENPSEEIDEQITVQVPQFVDSVVANAPESLVRIAQAEVDRICLEAEQTTESMILPPPIVDPEAIESGYQDDNEEFPAPPDDLLEINGKSETMRDDRDSSGTEPTIPLATTDDGDSSKTEDTTAPSFAESEVKSNAQTPTQKNDDNKLESSITENVNTEVAINRDSTEGELTMEEDSKEEDIGSVLQTAKEKDMPEKSSDSEDSSANHEKAAIVIQASFRGFKTRQDLKKDVEEKASTSENTTKPISVPMSSSDSKENLAESSMEGEILAVSKPPERRPKRPDQIDVIPKHEQPPEEGIFLSEDISPLEYSLSESKDDTSSTTLSEEELNEKASKIQAGVRGYLVRKEQKAQKEAAIKIQSTYRGFKARKRLKQEEAS